MSLPRADSELRARSHRFRTALLSVACFVVSCAPQHGDSRSALGVDSGSESARSGPASPPSAVSEPTFHATRARDVTCGTDAIRRQPDALADLDRDGHLDRPSVVREGREFVVRLHRIPGFAKVGEWRIPGDSIEVATTRCRGTPKGDLYLHVGVAKDSQGNQWENSLYHLESGKLVVIADHIDQSNLFIDTDGDGCVDPIVTSGKTARIRHGSQWEALPSQFNGLDFEGAQAGYGQQEAVDLDGDGQVDLISSSEKGFSIIDPKTWKARFTRPGAVTQVDLGMWHGKRIIAFDDKDVVRVLDTSPAHRELATYQGAIYWHVESALDPAGDGSRLAVKTLRTAITDPKPPFLLHELSVDLASAADDSITSLGPVLLFGADKPSLVAANVTRPGSPMIAFPGSDAEYDIVSLSASSPDLKPFFHGKGTGELSVGTSLIDFDKDGRYEVLVRQSLGNSTCDLKGSGAEYKLFLIDGKGNLLWSDRERSQVFDPRVRESVEARARPMDLIGNGTVALRVRAGASEWYVVQNGLSVPDEIPPCLE